MAECNFTPKYYTSTMKQLSLLITVLILGQSAFSSTDRYRLMFNDDPSTIITIGWEQVSGSNPEVYYGTVDHGTNWAAYPNSITPYKTTNYMGMTNKFAVLTGLTPDTEYYFVIKDSDGAGNRYWFKTCPNVNTEKLSFVSGGDSRSGQTQRQNSNKMVAKIRPHAVLFGGDLVNTPGNSSVQTWFDDWAFATTSDDQMIPLVHSFGNHEEYGSGGAYFLRELFDVTDDAYYNVIFGGDLFSMYTLNGEVLPGHTIANSTVRSQQTAWLSSTLPLDNSIWKAAQYHRPIVPHYSGKGEGADEFDDWAQLFYDNGVRVVMESDAHVVKLTEEVKPVNPTASGNSSNWFTTAGIAPDQGITFIGEGSWGTIRPPDDSHPMTIGMGSFYSFNWITVDACKIQIRTIDTQSPNSVPEHSPTDLFSISAGLDAVIWKPSGLPTGVTEIVKCNPPDADFNGTPTTIFTGQTVNFTDLSTNTPTSWSWVFGDGNTSTAQNPSNVYNTAGTYTVSLTATNIEGSDTETKTAYIIVSDPIAPTADFVADNLTPSVGQGVNFTDLTIDNPSGWSWNFGDGGTSTAQNPTHVYNTAGVYTVTLTASNIYGSDDEIKTAYIDVQNGGSVSVPITSGSDDAEEDIGGTAGDMYLTSSDLEIGNDFGDEQYMALRFNGINVPQGATISNAKITFRADETDLFTSQLNIYIDVEDNVNATTFSLTPFDISGRTWMTQSTWPDGSVPGWTSGNIYDTPNLSSQVQSVVDKAGWLSGNSMAFRFYSDMGESSERVGDSYEGGYPAVLSFDWSVPNPPAPVAAASSSATSICSGENVTFTDNSTNGPTGWAWDFGDGGTSTSQNPSHTYTSAGTYTISLTATNGGGSDIITLTNHVTVTQTPTVDAGTNSTLCEGNSVNITATGASSYTWDNGLGAGAVHTVSPISTTTYEVTGSNGSCTDVDQITITVSAVPTVDAGTDNTICEGSSVSLNASGASTYSWDNGLGAGATQSVNPASTTTYEVTGSNGTCSDVDQITITVNPLPVVNAGTDASICEGNSISLNASGATTYTWDNSLGAGSAQSVSPATTTTYEVTGTTAGCSDIDQITITVDPLLSTGTADPQTVCINNTAVDLFDAISGEDAGGNWIDVDATSALSGSVLNATSLTAGNTYNFDYEIPANGACPQVITSTQITVESIVNAGTANAQTICIDETAFDLSNGLTGETAGGSWTDDDASGGLTAGEFNASIVTPGSYDLTYSISSPGCGSDTETLTVTVVENPVVITSGDLTICEGESTDITASGADTYDWDNGLGSGTTHSVSPTSTTTYEVIATDVNSCTANESLIVTVNPIPTVTLEPLDADTICRSTTPITIPNGQPAGGTYSGTGVSSNIFDPTAAGIGTHEIVYTFTDVNGCSNEDNQIIEVVECLGINVGDKTIFNLYPNPASSYIMIEREQASEFNNVKIFDPNGKVVYSGILINNPEEIRTENWAKGVYLIQLSDKSNRTIQKKILIN